MSHDPPPQDLPCVIDVVLTELRNDLRSFPHVPQTAPWLVHQGAWTFNQFFYEHVPGQLRYYPGFGRFLTRAAAEEHFTVHLRGQRAHEAFSDTDGNQFYDHHSGMERLVALFEDGLCVYYGSVGDPGKLVFLRYADFVPCIQSTLAETTLFFQLWDGELRQEPRPEHLPWVARANHCTTLAEGRVIHEARMLLWELFTLKGRTLAWAIEQTNAGHDPLKRLEAALEDSRICTTVTAADLLAGVPTLDYVPKPIEDQP